MRLVPTGESQTPRPDRVGLDEAAVLTDDNTYWRAASGIDIEGPFWSDGEGMAEIDHQTVGDLKARSFHLTVTFGADCFRAL